MTVAFMLDGVTHSGVCQHRRNGDLAGRVLVLPLTSDAGGVFPARRYMASAAAAWASR